MQIIFNGMLDSIKVALKKKLIRYILLTCALVFIAYFSISFVSKRPNGPVKQLESLSTDVVVVGAGPSGIAAAIEIARGGKSVILVEETDWLGGQMTAAAVPNMDEGYLLGSDAGIYGEFINEVKNFYGSKPINTCYWGKQSRCFEPFVGRNVIQNFIKSEPNISVMYNARIEKVEKNEANAITGVRVQNKYEKSDLLIIKTSVLIDASETGYAIPLAGASYRIGNSIGSATSSVDSCIQAITYPMVVRKYFDEVPLSLRMIPGKPPGGESDYKMQTKNFARLVTKTGNDWFVNGRSQTPYSWSFSTGYRGIPDSNSNASDYSATDLSVSTSSAVQRYTDDITKTIINASNDLAVDTFFFQNDTYRQKMTCRAKILSLQYLYYMQIDLGLSDWSIANDEGYASSFNSSDECPELKDFRYFEKEMPIMPYIRESQRLLGIYTLTGADIAPKQGTRTGKNFPSALAVGDYSTDLHGCDDPVDLEFGLDTTSTISVQRRMFEIPFESFVTKEIGGLIVAEKNISASRVASSALREQPIAMQTGLAAGAIALVSLRQDKLPSAVDYHMVQEEILKAGGRIFAK